MTRVLYSFPHRLGAGRICTTAYRQVLGLLEAGCDVTVMTASLAAGVVTGTRTLRTLSIGGMRLPVRMIGRWRACLWHDCLTARWLERNHHTIDVVHGWPLASLFTIEVARKHGIPFFLERPNTHTAYAYQAAMDESRLVGIELPEGHDHEFNARYLEREEKEYERADHLLCPSEFVASTFCERGFPNGKILRHQYGYDPRRFRPGSQQGADPSRGLVMLYAGVCEPRKGLHYALDAWLGSDASRDGKFIICGEFVGGYKERLGDRLNHPGISFLGHRNDLQQIMAEADLFVLSSVEEGSALVTYEARGSGCVLVVSDASGAVCEHGGNGLVHPMRDVPALTSHINQLHHDRERWSLLRRNSVSDLDSITWQRAGLRLASLYSDFARGAHD